LGEVTVAENTITALFLGLFFGWPILLGVLIWLAKPKAALDIMERCDRSVLKIRAKAESSTGRVGRYWRRPASRVLLIPARSTERIGDPFLRCGVKAALYPYAFAIVAVGTVIGIELYFILGCFMIILFVWSLLERLGGNKPWNGDKKSGRPKVSERQCPDCDSVKINPFLNEGDGKCTVCHGTGEGGLLDQFVDATNPFGRQGTECFKCHGTGQCQTCGGNGVVYR
jgi:hypothetical protein